EPGCPHRTRRAVPICVCDKLAAEQVIPFSSCDLLWTELILCCVLGRSESFSVKRHIDRDRIALDGVLYDTYVGRRAALHGGKKLVARLCACDLAVPVDVFSAVGHFNRCVGCVRCVLQCGGAARRQQEHKRKTKRKLFHGSTTS